MQNMRGKRVGPSLVLAAFVGVVLIAALPLPAAAASSAIGGHFELTDQNGRTVRDTDLRGKVALVFFGYTHCPDVCPITAANLAQALKLLGDRADQVVPVFITVDPERDTPKTIRTYLSSFDPRFVGLTGSRKRIAAIAAAYKAFYRGHDGRGKHDHHHDHGDAHAADYRIDHSTFVYIIGPDGRYRHHLAFSETPGAIADAVRPFLPRP